VSISKDTWVSVVVGLALTVAAASSWPWWWHLVFPSSPAQASAVTGMSGGCAPFQVYAQNRWAPYGTAIREQPNVLSTQVGSEPGNMSLSVNGWVYGRAAYPTNTPPWNSSVWYHLADGAGWVSFPGVRATPTSQDPTGLSKDGGAPAPTPTNCQAAVQ
jgi:hypothetical protein